VLAAAVPHPVVEVKFHPDGGGDDQDGMPQRQRRPTPVSPDAATARCGAHHHPARRPTSPTRPAPTTAKT
jgi:hypothetical protein